MQTGCLYTTKKPFTLFRTETEALDDYLNKKTRKLKASWNLEMTQDFQSLYGISLDNAWFETNLAIPENAVVMYAETGKTGSYKLVYGEMIGWTSDTLNLLEEVNLVEAGQVL